MKATTCMLLVAVCGLVVLPLAAQAQGSVTIASAKKLDPVGSGPCIYTVTGTASADSVVVVEIKKADGTLLCSDTIDLAPSVTDWSTQLTCSCDGDSVYATLQGKTAADTAAIVLDVPATSNAGLIALVVLLALGGSLLLFRRARARA